VSIKPTLPFRLGSTSYVIPDDIVPNARFLAPLVDDIELVLFEVESETNLPTPDVITELVRLAAEHHLTYTVHLPLDLRLASPRNSRRDPSLVKAVRVIQTTLPLCPYAFVVHLDGTEITDRPTPMTTAAWQEQAARSLEVICQAAGDPSLIAVENLESYDAAVLFPLLDCLPVSLCADVGHLLKNGNDPIPFLWDHLDRARVIHLHGAVNGRDHLGLDQIARPVLRRLVEVLVQRSYQGVLTLEVFSEGQFRSGREMVLALTESIRESDRT